MKTSIVTKGMIIFWGVYILVTIIHALLTNSIDLDIISNVDAYFLKTMLIVRVILMPVFFIIGYYGISFVLKSKWRMIGVFLVYIVLYVLLRFFDESLFWHGPHIVNTYIWCTLGGLFRIFFDWYKNRNKIIELERENTKSILAMMRMQINPHFLFNTLNNIDSLIKVDPPKASQMLIKLSGIMRYMLYESSTEKVEMKKELEYTDEYIELERLRMRNNDFLVYEKEGTPGSMLIAPMLFIPFIENAFKHAVDSNIERGILINFVIEDERVIFTCENKYDRQGVVKDSTHGVGLDTIRKRLELLYAGKYKLDIVQAGSVYKVFLEINTNEN